MWAGKWPLILKLEQYLNFVWTRFLIFVLVFVSGDYELWKKFSWHLKNFSSHFNEIWCVGRGQWVMHDGMPHEPIQGQGQGHETFKVRSSSIFKIYLFRHFLMWATDSETIEQYLNVWTRFLISVLVFVSRDYKLGTKFMIDSWLVVYLLRKKNRNRGFRFWQLFDRYRKYGL